MDGFSRGDKVVIKSTGRIGTVDRMENTLPDAPRRVVVGGVSRPIGDVDLLVGPWNQGDV